MIDTNRNISKCLFSSFTGSSTNKFKKAMLDPENIGLEKDT